VAKKRKKQQPTEYLTAKCQLEGVQFLHSGCQGEACPLVIYATDLNHTNKKLIVTKLNWPLQLMQLY